MVKKVINWNTDEPDEQQTNKPAANAADVSAKTETPTAIVNKNNGAAPPATIAAPQGNASDTSNADENNENEQKQTQQQSQQSNPQTTTAPKIGGVTLSGSAINPFMRAAANGHQALMSKGSAMQQLNRGITPTAPQPTSNETDEDEYPENYSANQQNQQTVPQQTSANNNNAADNSADNANKDSASNDNANNEGDSDPNVQKQMADADVKEDLSDVVNENKTDTVKSGDQSNDNAVSQADTDNKVEKQTDGNNVETSTGGKKVETSVENKSPNSVVADNVVATKTPTGYKYKYIDPKTGETTTYDSKVDYMARVSRKPTSDEEMKKEAKREKRRAIISAIGDGLSSLANLYFTGKGALSADFKPGMTEAAQQRIEALRAKWQKEKDNYDAIMLKANEDDQNAYYKDLAEARAKAKADREAADYEADKPLKDADREARLHKFEMDKANRPTQDELDNLKLANDLADEQNREKTGVDRATQFNQDQQTKRNKYSVDNRKRGGGSGGSGGSKSEKNLIKTPNGKITPDNASVRQAYSKLAEAGLVSGTANSIEGMVTAIQDYYDGGGRNYTETDGFLGKNKTKVHRGRGSDSYLDADIDGLLGNNKKSSKKENQLLMGKRIKNLYNQLSQDLDVGSYEDFEKGIQDPVRRNKLYNAVTKEGYDIGSLDDLAKVVETEYGKSSQQPQSAPSQAKPKAQTQTQSVQPQPVQVQTQSKSSKKGFTPSPQQWMQMQNTFANQKARLKAQGEDFDTRLENSKKSVKGKKDLKPNLDKGKFEEHEYSTHGDDITDPLTASQTRQFENAQYQQHKFEEFLKTPEGKLHFGHALDSEKDYNDALKYIDGKVKTLSEELNAEKKKIVKAVQDEPWYIRLGSINPEAMDTNPSEQFENEKTKQLSQSIDKFNEVKSRLEQAHIEKAQNADLDKSSGLGWLGKKVAYGTANTFRGFGHGMANSWTDPFGGRQAAAVTEVVKLANKLQRGENLTNEEQNLLDAALMQQAAESNYDLSAAYDTVGEGGAEMANFMLMNALNPASGVGRGASMVAERALTKWLGKTAMKQVMKKAVTKAGKMATRVAGDALEGAVAANTVGLANTLADAGTRHVGNIKGGMVDGNWRAVGTEGGESWGEAFTKAEVGQTIEFQSELVGEYFGPVLKATGKYLGKGVSKAVNAVGSKTLNKSMESASNLINKFGGAKGVQVIDGYLKRGGWHGSIGEFAEEIVGGVENALLVGDQTLDTNPDTGVFNAHNMVDTALGVGVSGIVLSHVQLGGYAATRAKLNRAYKKSCQEMERVYGEDWKAEADKMFDMEDQELADYISKKMKDSSLSEEQRKTLWDYTKSMKAKQYVTLAEMNDIAKGAVALIDQNKDNGYTIGYDKGGQGITEGLRAQQDAYDKATKVIKPSTMAGLVRKPDNVALAQLKTNVEKEAYLNYINAREQYHGSIECNRDDAADQISDVTRLHRNLMDANGNIVTATTTDGSQVKIVSDTIVRNDDGTVDMGKSTHLVIVDADGKRRMVEASAIESIDNTEDGNNLIQQKTKEISDKFLEQEASAKLVVGNKLLVNGETRTIIDVTKDGNVLYATENNPGTIISTDATNFVIETLIDEANRGLRTEDELTRLLSPYMNNSAEEAERGDSGFATQEQVAQGQPSSEDTAEMPVEQTEQNVENADNTIEGNPIEAQQNNSTKAPNAEVVANEGEEQIDQPTEQTEVEETANTETQPTTIESGTELVILNEDGTESPAIVTSRGHYENGEYVEDGNGDIIEYVADGKPHYETEEDLRSKADVVVEEKVETPTEERPTEQVEQPTGQKTENTEKGAVEKPVVQDEQVEAPTETKTEERVETPTEQAPVEQKQSALERIPKNEKGEPVYEQTDAETAWDAIVEQTDGDEQMAKDVADSMVADKQDALKQAEKAKPKKGVTPAEKIAAAKQRQQNIDKAKAELEHWQNIAATQERRAKAGQQRIAEEKMRAEQQYIAEEEQRKVVEQRRQEIEAQKAEQARLAEERRKAEAEKANTEAVEQTEKGSKENSAPIEQKEKASKETVSPLSKENVKDSAVSDDATAKVQQKPESVFDMADKAAAEYEQKQKDKAAKPTAKQAEAEKPQAKLRTKQKLSQKSRAAIESIADKMGYKVVWHETLEDNGFINHTKKEIHLAADAEKPVEAIFGHEATHAIRRLSEADYHTLRDTLKKLMGDEWWNEMIERKRKAGYSEDKLEEEVTADAVGDTFFDEEKAVNLARELEGKPNILAKLRETWQRIIAYLKSVGESAKLRQAENSLAAFDAIVNSFKSAKEKAERKTYDGSAEIPTQAQIGNSIAEKVENYDPTAVPWKSGTLTEGQNAPIDRSVRSLAEGVDLKLDITDDGRVVINDASTGRVFDKEHPVTADYLRAQSNSVLNYIIDDAVKFGLTEDGRKKVEKEAENIYNAYAEFLNRLLEKGDESFEYLSTQWAWEGEVLEKTVSTNIDSQYKFSLDITRVCKKNEAVIRGISELQKRQGYGVTPGQILDIYNKTVEAGYQVPCPVCYVFSRYINNGKYATILINGQQKYGDKLTGPNKWTAAEWVAEMERVKAENKEHSKIIEKARTDIRDILQEVDKLSLDITSGKLKGNERKNAEKRIQYLSDRYTAALNVISQSGLDGWITNFAIVKKEGQWRLRNDYKPYPAKIALDLRLSAEAKRSFPGVARYRNSRGSAAGKEIAFAAENPLGDVAQFLGASDLTKARNFYQEAAKATNPLQRDDLLKKARKSFMRAKVYAAQQLLRGGVRQWSWSDNVERLAPDVMGNNMQLALLQAGLQTYSKQLEGVELIARLKGYVNGSLMGKGKGYMEVDKDYSDGPVYFNKANGKYYTLVFDNVAGIEPFSHDGKLGLFDLNRLYDRAGNIIVGMDDIHIRTALADPRIFFVIPRHASGMANHILKQFYNFLGVDTSGLDAQDYTNVQEEKKFSADDSIPESVTSLWEEHNANGKYKCGLGIITSGNEHLSKEQLHYRELRDSILLHNTNEEHWNKKDREFWESHQDWLNEINNDEFLSQTRKKVESTVGVLGVAMTKDDTNFVYPYEYWDTHSTVDKADVNGERYLEYCRRLGYCPKFVGMDKSNGFKKTDIGNFCNDTGYWNLLVDRRMYDTKGNYQDLTPVTFEDFDVDLVDPENTKERFDVTRVADEEETSSLIDSVQSFESQRGITPQVDYGLTLNDAAEVYQNIDRSKREEIKTNNNLDEINDLFNEELQKQANGELEDGHIYKLGRPSAVLQSTGIPNLPIELSAKQLQKKATDRGHIFDIEDVKDLPNAIQHPLAIFEYGNKAKSQNLIVAIERDGKNFVVGIHFNQNRRGLEVNDIRGLFNKNNAEWLNWISQGKSLFLDKEKIQALIDKQRTNLAEVKYLDLDDVTKIVDDFDNSKLSESKQRDFSKRESSAPLTEREHTLRDALVDQARAAGLDVVVDEQAQQVLDAVNDARYAKRVSEQKQWKSDYVNAYSAITGRDKKTVRNDVERMIADAHRDAKKLYEKVLAGNVDDVTLQQLNDYIDNATPRNKYYRPISKRLPSRALFKVQGYGRTNVIDALYSRICESAVPKNGRTSAEGRRKIEARKEELLEGWAKATGNWHESVADFTSNTTAISSGTDSDVYLSDDGKTVIKASKGKFDNRKFPSDIDQVALFNYVFPGSAYRILGYGKQDGKFVKFLEQRFVDFSTSTPLTTEERVAHMHKLGFEPFNKEKTVFSNGEIVVSDLQKSNIVRDKDGNIRVIDADVKLHTKDIGGEYTYPDVETDTEASIPDGARFFRTKDGEAYGFTVDGKIYLDPRIATSETAIHEYTHLFSDMVRSTDPKQWNHLVGQLKGSELWNEVKERYPELTTDDEIADEVFSTFSGRRGAERLRKEAERITQSNQSVFDKAKAMAVLQNVRDAIRQFWNKVAEMFGIHRMRSAEELADMSLADLIDSKNPTKGETNNNVRYMGSRTNKRMAEIGKHYEGKKLSDEQRAIVDVFSGKKDRQTVDIINNDGKSVHLEMQQGNEPNAGTRHSIFRHVGKNNGSISYDEIGLIPDIVKTGTRNDKGANVVYQKKIDGVRYTIYTDKKGNKEIFHDFYSNRKTTKSESFSGKSTNTQSSARTSDNAVSVTKLAGKVETASDASENVRYSKREPLQRREGESIFAYADRVVDEKARTEAMQNEDTDSHIDYSRREEPAPKKTIEVFKLMRLEDDDKLYPLFIDNSNSVDLKAWYNADSPDLSALKPLKSGVYLVDTKTNEAVQTLDEFRAEHPDLAKTRKVEGYPYPTNDAINYATEHGLRWMHIEDTARGQKRFGGESRKYWNIGINGSGVPYKFSMRPGWHAGSLPTMRQIGKGSNRDLRDDKFVWVKGEISADIDYNEEAQHNPDKDIPDRIPKDGFYLKATNANKTASQADKVGWYVAGAFKPNQVISDAQARKVIDDWNAEHDDNVLYDFAREGGKEFTDADAARINKANGVDFSKREIDANTSIAIVKAEADHGFSNYADAKSWAKENIVRTYNDEETNGKGNIRISNTAISKFLSQSAIEKSDSQDVHLAVLRVLPDVIRESIDAEQHADFLKGKDGKRGAENGVNPDVTIHRLYGAVNIDGKIYRVKTTIKEDSRDENLPSKAYSYEATKIELLAGTLGKPESDAPNTSNSITAANLLKGVDKSYSDEQFFADQDFSRREADIDRSQREGDDSSTKPERKKAKPNETKEIWNDQNLSLQERITAAMAKLAAKHQDDKTIRNDAMQAIGGNIASLRKAMATQRKFDQSTVKRVADLAQILITSGHLSGLTAQEVKRLLAVTKGSVGRKQIEASIQKVMDIMIDNQLRNAENYLDTLCRIKESKVNAQGVEVQGQLDADGATIMKTFKKAREMDKTQIEETIADALQRTASTDEAVANEAALEYTGLSFAREYADNIKASKAEEDELRKEMKQAKEGATEEERATDAYKQYMEILQENIRQNKIERMQSYYNLAARLTDGLRASMANASAFKESEKERIRSIQHNANSDMEGRPCDEHYQPKFMDMVVNSSPLRFLFAPLVSFEQMLKLFGRKSVSGEGYLYNRFFRGWVDARQKELRGIRNKNAILDGKVEGVFGGKIKSWGELICYASKLPTITVGFMNGGEMRSFKLNQGNALYIYMVNKMDDGKMKLRKMGISEQTVDSLADQIDPRLKEIADWVQNEFFVDIRNEYNQTHKRMFGTSMAAIEDYFPLKILSNALTDKAEALDNDNDITSISTSTGSIIKRRRNSLALDILNADALLVVLDHVQEMEHWNAFAEFKRDLATLITYKRFRNQVQNMTSIYGSGERLWKQFKIVSKMALGEYRPPKAEFDSAAVNFAKGVSAAKVAFRLFTALKQFLSMPAYIPEVSAKNFATSLLKPKEAWDWAMANLPIFEKRWKGRMAGDPRLMATNKDWKMWRSNIVQLCGKYGMTPNAFVDALTVSIGAHAIYKTKYEQYRKDGYNHEVADRKANQDAETLYNLTQQSSEGSMMAPMQVDRSWLAVLFSVFRNSSMAYGRQLHDAVRNLKNVLLTSRFKAKSLRFMQKQYERDGLDSRIAQANAERKYNRQVRKDFLRVATFGFILQYCWNLGSQLPYLLFGDDDDEKKKMAEEALAHSAFGWAEGYTGGDVISSAVGMLITKDINPSYLEKDMPLTSDISNILLKFGSGKTDDGISDVINLVVQSGIGVNPQSITDAVLAIYDACGDDPTLAHEAAICISRILQVPQSQINKMYFDEVNLRGDEISKYTPAQLAERYARYRVKRGALYAPWTWNEEDRLDKQKDQANTIVKERLAHLNSDKVNEGYQKYEEAYKNIREQITGAKVLAKFGDEEGVEKKLAQIGEKNLTTYKLFSKADSALDKVVKAYLDADTPEFADYCKGVIVKFKKEMVIALSVVGTNKQDQELQRLSDILDDFAKHHDAHSQQQSVNKK